MQFRVVFCWIEKLFYVELIKHVRISPPQIFCCIDGYEEVLIKRVPRVSYI